MAKQNIGTGLWQTIRGAINNNFDELYEYRGGAINVLELGIRNDGVDQTSAIGALLNNNTQLFFPKGSYLINNLIVSNKKGLSFIGEKGTRFFTTNNYVFTFHSDIEELEITGIKFESTLVSNTEDTGGLLLFYTDASAGVFEDVEIHHCYFTNEKTKCNAIKIISEGSNSMARNFKIHHNVFEKIGRMAIEVQNHINDSVYRYIDIHSYNNYLRDIGTVHTATSTCGISYSGLGYNCSVDSNQIIDIHTVDSWAVVNYGIENAGADNMSIQNNQILSLNYGFTAILASSARAKTGCIIANNTINVRLVGSTDPLKVRGMELFRLTKSKISNNSIFSHNYGIRVVAGNKLMITLNDCYSKAGNAVFVTGESTTGTTDCKFYFNNLDCSEATEDSAPLIFSGSNTTNNFQFGNNCIKAGGAAGSIASVGGATDNTKAYLAAATAEFVSRGFEESVRMVGNDGQISFPDFGRSVKASKNGALAGMSLDATVLDVTHQLAVEELATLKSGASSGGILTYQNSYASQMDSNDRAVIDAGYARSRFVLQGTPIVDGTAVHKTGDEAINGHKVWQGGHIAMSNNTNIIFANAQVTGAARWGMGNEPSDDSFRLINLGLSNTAICVSGAGNVGVGTVDTQSRKFAVGGSALVSEGLTCQKLNVYALSVFADNAAAKAGGLQNGDLYRTGDILKVVHD